MMSFWQRRLLGENVAEVGVPAAPFQTSGTEFVNEVPCTRRLPRSRRKEELVLDDRAADRRTELIQAKLAFHGVVELSSNQSAASSLSLRKNSHAAPWMLLVPDLIVALRTAPRNAQAQR